MPRNSQGLYTLPAGNPVVPNTLIESVWANSTMDDVALALTGSLPRDGSAPMTGLLTLSADAPTAPRNAISKGYLDQFLAYATGMPIGSVVAYAGASVPTGFFECNGQSVSRTLYPDLFATIGTIYGAGDASTTFNVPDMRDEFIRGKSAARAVGSKQAGSFASHTHTYSDPGHSHALSDPGHSHTASQPQHNHGVNDPSHSHPQNVSSTPGSGFAYGTGNIAGSNTANASTGISIQLGGGEAVTVDGAYTGAWVTNSGTGLSIGGTGGAETVPQNIAQIYIIKAVNDSTGGGGGGGGTGTLTGVTSSDPNMIAIDNTDPAVPLLDIQANVAFGIPQLDVNGQIPTAQIPVISATPFVASASGGSISVTQNVTTVLPLDTIVFDPDGGVSLATDRITVPVDGYYQVTAAATYNSGIQASSINGQVLLNGVFVSNSGSGSVSGATFPICVATELIHALAGQYFQVAARHNASNAVGGISGELCVHLVRAG